MNLQKNMGYAWVGNIYLKSAGRDYIGLSRCLNCDCQCGDKEPSQYEQHGCNFECENQQFVNFGITKLSQIEGDTKCRNGEVCKFVVSYEGLFKKVYK